MAITKIYIPDVLIIEPKLHRDSRGYFFETFNLKDFQEKAGEFKIVQANQSKSKCGVIRGLHYQNPPYSQAKLVRVIKGRVLDVIVDLRTDSPTFGQHFSTILDGINKMELFVPKGFAHGFITLTKDAIFQYFVDAPYMKESESGIIYNDETLSIDWIKKYMLIVSDKDRALKKFNQNIYHTKEEFNQNYM